MDHCKYVIMYHHSSWRPCVSKFYFITSMHNFTSKIFIKKILKIQSKVLSQIGSSLHVEIYIQDISKMLPHYNVKESLDHFLYESLFKRCLHVKYKVTDKENDIAGYPYTYQFQWGNLQWFLQKAKQIKPRLEHKVLSYVEPKLISSEVELEQNVKSRNYLHADYFKKNFPNYKTQKNKPKTNDNCPRYIQPTDQLPKGAMKYLFPNEFEYDIEAAAYALLYQHAVIYAECDYDFQILHLCHQDKNIMRSALADELKCSIDIAKLVLAAVLYRRSIPQIEYSRNFQKDLIKHNWHRYNWPHLQEAMRKSEILNILCFELKIMWEYLEAYWEDNNNQIARDKFVKWYEKEEMHYDIDEAEMKEVKVGKWKYSSCAFRAYIYFELERQVIDICIDWLEEHGYDKYYTKHDSFWCPYDISDKEMHDLQKMIANKTCYELQFSKHQFN